jgi:hypothetical protein
MDNKFVNMLVNNQLINLLARVFVLGLIVFLVLTFIPTTPFEIKTRVIIAFLVVVTYSILDLMGVTLARTKDSLCNVLC